MKSDQNDYQSSMQIVLLLMKLRQAMREARLECARNRESIQQLYEKRTDAAHDIENCRMDDPVEEALARAGHAAEYAEISAKMRLLINENATLEVIANNPEFEHEVDRIVERMTGQMQYLDHAVYHRRGSAWGGDAAWLRNLQDALLSVPASETR